MRLTTVVWNFGACLLIPCFLSAQTGSTPATGPAEDDVRQEIRQVEAILPKLPDRGAGLFLLAHDYAHIGDFQKALSLLR